MIVVCKKCQVPSRELPETMTRSRCIKCGTITEVVKPTKKRFKFDVEDLKVSEDV